jgi:putative transposase
VPRRLHRYYGAGYLHFITTSCYQRKPLLRIPRARDLFLEVLEEVRRRFRFVVVGYVVMPEHVHLLIGEPERENPSVVMQALKESFAKRMLQMSPPIESRDRWGSRRPEGSRSLEHRDRWGSHDYHFWQRRFYDFVVCSERKRIEKLRYIHRNPVHRGLVERPEDWPWSSFRHHATGEIGPVEIESQWTARRRERAGITLTLKSWTLNRRRRLPLPSRLSMGGNHGRLYMDWSIPTPGVPENAAWV